jgi:ribosomal protein S18 acetylase RimI-like enzyme
MAEKPTVRILQPSDEAALEAFLLPRIASSMFLLGNMRAAGLVDRGKPYQGTYAAAFVAGEIVGVVAHYWNRNLIFQAPVHVNKLWRRAVEASGRPIGGLIGPEAQVDTAKEALNIDECAIQLDETERLYRLELDELVVPHALASGQVVGRRAAPRDLELLVAWQVAYGAEALGEADTVDSRQRVRSAVQRLVKQNRTWVLEAGGEPVACSSFNTATEEAVQVGGVWTPPDIRSRGYGRAVVAASLRDARADGVTTAILFTGRENVPAQRAYEALGFQHVGAYRMLLLDAALDCGTLAFRPE